MGIHVHKRKAGAHGQSFKAKRNQENSKVAQELHDKYMERKVVSDLAWAKYQLFIAQEAYEDMFG